LTFINAHCIAVPDDDTCTGGNAPDVAPIDRLAQQPDAVAPPDPDPANRPRWIRPAADTANRAGGISHANPAHRAGGIRSTTNAANKSRGISSANPAHRAGGIRSSSHDTTSCLALSAASSCTNCSTTSGAIWARSTR